MRSSATTTYYHQPQPTDPIVPMYCEIHALCEIDKYISSFIKFIRIYTLCNSCNTSHEFYTYICTLSSPSVQGSQAESSQPEPKMQKQERGCTRSIFKTAGISGYFITEEKVKSVTEVPSIRAVKEAS